MAEKIQSLLTSRRFLLAVGGVVTVAASSLLGLSEEEVTKVVAIVVGWIVGDSIRETKC